MTEATQHLSDQFVDAAQQEEAARLGMWTFLASEVLFFGGLFLAYIIYRHSYPGGFSAGSQQTDVTLGTFNTALLLTSSLTMALSIQAARQDKTRSLVRLVGLTLLLGLGFLVVKGFEYHKDIGERLVPGSRFRPGLPQSAQIFFWLYWAMTGLHALHVTIGCGLLTVMVWLGRRGRFGSGYFTPLEMTGLYWHFVDLVWVFLYPLLYLIGRHA